MAITQRGAVLTLSGAASNDHFGSAVALSSAGDILAVGINNGNAAKGEAAIYDLASGTWAQRGSVLTAPDAAAYDSFGAGISLSGNGLVLAIGAPGWEGTLTDQGAVYIYDWSGSAWVQRGSVLHPGAAGDAFGSSVSLSNDGAVLVVGAPLRNGGLAGQGGVYVYDWSGGAWVQRGSVLVAGDAAANDYFGQGVSVSSSGLVLAVGAQRRASGGSYRGGVYTYDYSGGSWGQRGSVLTAADAADYDAFGYAVALSGDGLVLGVTAIRWKTNAYSGHVYLYDVSGTAWAARVDQGGADTVSGDSYGSGLALSNTGSVMAVGALGWEGTLTDQGGVYTYDVSSGDIISAPTVLTVNASTATLTAPTLLYVAAAAIASAPTVLTVSYPQGSASAPTVLTMQANGSASAPTALAVVDSSQHWPLWSPRVIVGGVDISAQLEGTIDVDAEEGAARVAHFTIAPTAGTVAPLDYVGKTVSIDYLQIIAGATVSRRLFTGRIDTPRYDPNTRLLAFDCVDDLQNRVAALDRATIDLLIGGKYSAAVQGDFLDNWDYAQARLETVAASLDAGASSDIRITPWTIAATWATFSDGDLLFEKSTLTEPQRSTLTNEVVATFQYRYPRLRQRYTSTGWSGTQIDMAPNGWQYPTQQDILSAVGGTGWTVTSAVFYPAPAAIPHSSGGFIYPAAGSIDMAILHLAQRHSQTVTETFTLTVQAPESITANGPLRKTTRGALESKFDGTAWESALDVAPLMPTGGDMDYAPDAPRADADYAIETLLEQAQVKILGSHRSARVGNALLLNPDMDLDKKVAISTTDISASGKVARVRHLMDLEAGSAISEFEIACYGVGGAGIITPDTLTAPTPPAAAADTEDWGANVPALQVNNYGITPYSDALMGLLLNPPKEITVQDIPGVGSKSFPNPYYYTGSYPITGFRASMPGVADTSRNPVDKAVAQAYQLVIPTDTLTITIP